MLGIPQPQTERLLAEHAVGLGAQLRRGCALVDVDHNEDGVTAALSDGTTVRARWLVGCDGAGSPIRKALEIPFELIKQMDFSLSAMLRIENLERYHAFGSLERFMFIGPEGTWGNMTSVDGRGLYRFTVVGAESALATSPANRPTPTTLTGPLGSLGPEPNAAWTIPTIFCGMRRTTPAVLVTPLHSTPGTSVTGWRTSSYDGLTPRKPTRSVIGCPLAPVTTRPWSSVTGRSATTGVTWTLRSRPSVP